MSSVQPEPTPARSAWAEERSVWDRIAVLILALEAALLLAGAWRVGPTFDEHFYAASGVAYLEQGALEINREHPPLLKYVAGLPLVLAGVDLAPHATEARNFPVALFYQREGEHLDRNLFLARVPFCLLTLAATALAWRAARARFGPAAGAGAALLLGLNPSVIAHGRLVSLDAGVTPLFFAAVLAFLAALERPTWRARLGAAAAFGLANLAKFTALALGPIFVGLALLQCARMRSARPLATLALTFLGGLGVFAAGYGFEARAYNSAWGSEQFVRDVPPAAVAPADLAQGLADAGADAADVERVAQAPDVSGAVDLLLSALGDPRRAPLAARALERLARAPGDLKKRAFERVLDLPADRLTTDERDRALAALCGRRAQDLDGWRAFWNAERGESWDRIVLYNGWLERLTVGLLGHRRPIPLLTALKGLDQTLAHGAIGHGSYFRGRVLLPGRDFAEGNPHPEYYAVVMGVKNPIAWLALVALGAALALVPRDARRLGPLGLAAFLGVPLVLFAIFSLGKALLGVRYLLPLYPFLAVLGGVAFARLPRIAWALAAVAVLEWAWIHPHELMYYNALAGGPSRGTAITVVGDDWGQDARAVGRFYARYRAEIDAAGGLHYRPYTMADPKALGLEDVQPPVGPGGPGGPTAGIVAVHAVDYRREAQEFAWLAEYEPFLVIGHSVLVFDTRPGPPGGDPLAAWEAAR